MQREIRVSRKTIHAIVFLIIVLALIGAGFLIVRRDPARLSMIVARLEGITPTPIQITQPPDAQAAVKALIAFYTLYYTVPEAQWQAGVCALSTPNGCQLIQSLFAPTVRQVVEANQVKTGCTVQAVRMVEESTPQGQSTPQGYDGATRIWQLEVTLSNPWPGEKATTPVYAEVAQANGTWLLNRILFDQEAARFAATPTP
jgi:hypothetical protein